MRSMRVFFATDIHGSRACWRKFLRCGEFYDADVLILGGDMTGKGLVPIIGAGDGYRSRIQDQIHELRPDEVDAFKSNIQDRGLYPFTVSEDEFASLVNDSERLDELFHEEVLRHIERWVALADERLSDSGVRCFVCPGNDDMPEIDEILRSSRRLEVAEGEAIEIGGYTLVSTGWSNQTPWNTYREYSEEEIGVHIRGLVERSGASSDRLIFNFHCPPHDTPLDEAPALTDDLRLVEAGRVTKHVGSTAVRELIEDAQPALALHGHIHESRGVVRLGRTLAVNPGSSYEQGVLQGALIRANGKNKIKHYQLTTG
jgi:uncharacterized protein